MAIDKIGSAAITDCTVVAADISPGTITNAKLAGSIANAKLANSSVTINGTSISLGASGSIPAVAWQSVVVSDGSTVTTMVAGRGYFVDNTSASGIVKLPASASAGDTVAIKDYAGNFGTNSLLIQRNSHKIQGVANDSSIETNRASVTLVYVDATKGWLYANESNVADLQNVGFIEATGGTVTTQTNHKVHAFTGDGCFVVSQLGFGGTPCSEATTVEYLVVAGGGAGGNGNGGGGGGGGFRMSTLPISATTFPITVGAGGAAAPESYAACSGAMPSGSRGSNSVFSTITSTGGGGAGGGLNVGDGNDGLTGGSGGGGGTNNGCGGAGNTPPVSPSQGNPGGDAGGPGSGIPFQGGGGGGGAAAQGTDVAPSPQNAGPGGAGSPAAPVFGSAPQPFYIANGSCAGASACGQFAGGGGGGAGSTPSTPGGTGGVGGGASGTNGANTAVAGIANTGGGGGGGRNYTGSGVGKGGAGGKGIVLIRYKFQ
jgi:hypothetical protein